MKPEWIDEEAWDGFVEMRKSIKKPLTTDRAITRLINRLAEFKQKGHDPNACLDQSTFNNWQDVYPVKSEPIPDLRPRETFRGPEKMTPEQKAAADKARVLVMSAFKGKVA